MDFEVEDDPYDYEWNNKSKGGSKKSSSSYFGGGGGGDDDEYAYDYQSSSKNKKSQAKSSGSPQMASKSGAKPNNVVMVDSSSALDKAKNMLSKYSSKPSEPAPKLQKSTKSFNEDDISIDSEDFSDMDMSESEDFKHKTTNAKSKGDTTSKKGKKNINDLGSPEAIVTVSMGDNEEESDVDFDDAAREFLNRSNLSDSAQKGDLEEDSEHDNYSNEDFDIDDKPVIKTKATSNARGKYDVDLSESDALDHTAEESNNDFEIEQSNAHTASNDFEVEGEDEDNNASYSRMVYGNGDEEDEDEVHSSVEDREVDDEVEDEMEVSNKPIILSFADLAAIPSWEQTSYENGDLTVGQSEIEESVAEVEESEILEKPIAKPTSSVAAVSKPSAYTVPSKTLSSDSEKEEDDDIYDDDEYNDEFEESRVEVTAPPAPVAVTKSVTSAKSVVSAPVETKKPPVVAPVVAKSVPPAVVAPPPVAVAPVPTVVVQSAAPSVTAAPVAPPPPSVAAAPSVAPPAASGVPPQSTPAPSPYGYMYPYGPPPPPGATHPGYPPSDPQQQLPYPPQPYPYAAAPPPPYPYYSPYGMWAPPPAPHMMPPYPFPPYYDPRSASTPYGGLGGVAGSMPPQQNPFSPFQYPQSSLMPTSFAGSNASSAQPLVLDLLQELRKTKEEAEWAKQKLAETMLFVRDQEASAERLRKSESALHTTPASVPASSSGAVKLGSPKASKTPAVVVNRAASTAASSTAPAAASRKSRYSELNHSVSESLDEVNESEILDETGEINDYSDDFDQESHLNLSTYSSAGAVPHKASPLKSAVKHVTLPDIPEEQAMYRKTGPASAPAERPQSLYEPPSWRTERPAFSSLPATRESVVDPLKQSLAHSLLSSQELFKNQIESLRLRISMANATSSAAERHWEATRTSLPMTYPTTYQSSTFKPAASLAELKNEFAKKRLDDTRKLYEVLTRAYPDLGEAEAVYIAEKF